MTKEEILKRNLLWLSDMKIQRDNDRVWAQFTSTDFTKSIYQAMQEYSDQQNSSLIKEVEELKEKLLSANEALMEVSAKWYADLLNEKDLEISQLKEANNKLNYAMIEWDTTHPIEDENRELQRRVKQLIEALEKIAQMSDSGSYENTIISMKSIATQALKEKE